MYVRCFDGLIALEEVSDKMRSKSAVFPTLPPTRQYEEVKGK
jgi:hypothetical protein